VLGALARMQLRLDVLAREQSDMFAQVMARLDEIAASSGVMSDEVPLPPVRWPEPGATEPSAPLAQEPRSWGSS
jgi:hypothetical protein